MTREVAMTLEPSAPRQLGEDGLVIFLREGREPGRREGLACILSVCPHPECPCQLVNVDGFVIDEPATAVSWDREGVHLVWLSPPDSGTPRITGITGTQGPPR